MAIDNNKLASQKWVADYVSYDLKNNYPVGQIVMCDKYSGNIFGPKFLECYGTQYVLSSDYPDLPIPGNTVVSTTLNVGQKIIEFAQNDNCIIFKGVDNYIYRSTNSSSFTKVADSSVYNGKLFVANGTFFNCGSYITKKSTNGSTWTTINNIFSNNYAPTNISWFPEIQKFVAGGYNKISTSSDGITWTEISVPPQSFGGYDGSYSGDLRGGFYLKGKYYGCFRTSNGYTGIFYTTDFSTWTYFSTRYYEIWDALPVNNEICFLKLYDTKAMDYLLNYFDPSFQSSGPGGNSYSGTMLSTLSTLSFIASNENKIAVSFNYDGSQRTIREYSYVDGKIITASGTDASVSVVNTGYANFYRQNTGYYYNGKIWVNTTQDYSYYITSFTLQKKIPAISITNASTYIKVLK